MIPLIAEIYFKKRKKKTSFKFNIFATFLVMLAYLENKRVAQHFVRSEEIKTICLLIPGPGDQSVQRRHLPVHDHK